MTKALMDSLEIPVRAHDPQRRSVEMQPSIIPGLFHEIRIHFGVACHSIVLSQHFRQISSNDLSSWCRLKAFGRVRVSAQTQSCLACRERAFGQNRAYLSSVT